MTEITISVSGFCFGMKYVWALKIMDMFYKNIISLSISQILTMSPAQANSFLLEYWRFVKQFIFLHMIYIISVSIWSREIKLVSWCTGGWYVLVGMVYGGWLIGRVNWGWSWPWSENCWLYIWVFTGPPGWSGSVNCWLYFWGWAVRVSVFPPFRPSKANARSSTSLLDLVDFMEAFDPLNPPVDITWLYDSKY